MPLFIDREKEIAELRALADSGDLKLALLYGRRRVGKTYLLTHLCEKERVFYFTASATSPEINRRVLIEEAAAWSHEDLRAEDTPTWRSVFRALFGLRPEQNIVIVLDELQYLASDTSGLIEVTSELNAVWESKLPRSGGLLIILSGSSVGTLAALSAGGSPLYGRFDWVRQLRPFDYLDAGKMIPAYSLADRIRTYAAFGGMPKYLAAVDDARPLEENIVRLLLDPHGEVRLQLETALRQEEGLREFTKYQGILEAVGVKRRAIGPIAAALSQGVDTALRRMVTTLVDLGFLEAERNFREPKNHPPRFRIADPALRFHFGLTLPNESAIAASGAETVWRNRLAPQAFPTYVGKEVFEEVVRQAYLRHREAHGLPAVKEWSRWEGRDRDRQDIEIDIVARLLDDRILTGSAKFRGRPADASVLLEHVDALKRLAGSGRAWARAALESGAPLLFVSVAGFTDSFYDVASHLELTVTTWALEDLFGTPPPAIPQSSAISARAP